ncbi:hypothetical protein OGAPHI_005486 [Ogataea philodendri]|uniref:Uncharacterized protein n=1 Tax=Ogataea philodendri TaxID=1378263 RepID=A0A9P8T0Y3_9ASCO|nr:uncharacterized protein OGAPHI_005486 [Ogataea philodendri]KAH3662238.1 hypothetical protein OGAPHI_005486 [Ogataea philodendri]
MNSLNTLVEANSQHLPEDFWLVIGPPWNSMLTLNRSWLSRLILAVLAMMSEMLLPVKQFKASWFFGSDNRLVSHFVRLVRLSGASVSESCLPSLVCNFINNSSSS